MLKVIIIDDEITIREGLASLIDWRSHGFEVCALACNGQEGLEKLTSTSFDLAIVDIKMPLLSGIDMITHIKSNTQTHCRFLLLTAYSDFHYAQQAISLGVDAYLLKPISKKELIEKLALIKNNILTQKETHKKLISYDNYEKSIFINDFLAFSRSIDIEQINKRYGFNFPWPSYCVAVIHFDSKDRLVTLPTHTIYNTIDAFMKDVPHVFTYHTTHACGIIFDPSVDISNHIYHLQRFLSQRFNTFISICIGKEVATLDTLSNSFHSALLAIQNRFLHEHKGIIYAADFEVIPKLVNETMDFPHFSQLLFDACKLGNAIMLNNLLEKLCQYFKSSASYNENLIKISYVSIYTNFTHLILVHINNFPNFILNHNEIIEEINQKNTLQELHAYFKYLLISFTSELSQSITSNDIHSIITYINKHYNEPLKLEPLATLFGYNSTYLGKLIRKNTGYQFNTYLDMLRIEQAKKLLLEGMRVYDVCEHVGFNNTDYFTKKFKKYVGKTPSQYKL